MTGIARKFAIAPMMDETDYSGFAISCNDLAWGCALQMVQRLLCSTKE
jgi:hypothetical protein